MKPIETRNSEIRYTTSDPMKMRGRFIAKRVLRTWKEDYVDKDTNKVVQIERSEVLFDRSVYIDDDILTQIRFWMAEGAIKEIEVSNQKRMSFEFKNTTLFPYRVCIRHDDKRKSFLLYASSAQNALIIVTDYVELNMSGGFNIIEIKELDSFVVLIDRLKIKKINTVEQDGAEAEDDDFSAEKYLNQVSLELKEEESEDDDKTKLKFYQISSRIVMSDKIGDEERTQTFVVNTFNCTWANMLIEKWLRDQQAERIEKARDNPDFHFEEKDIHAFVEESKIVPFGTFIPMEFSLAYKEE